MPLRIDVPEKFLNLFHKIFENEPIENGNKLNLFLEKTVKVTPKKRRKMTPKS